MKPFPSQPFNFARAFSLVEMLIVIAIIALLAALIVPMAGNAFANRAKARAQSAMAQLEVAIDSYKAARGHYPPDQPNPTNSSFVPLFYELTGTVYESIQGNTPERYYRINGGESIPGADVKPVFGVDGFVNSSSVRSRGDRAQLQAAEARDYFTSLKTDQYYELERAGRKFHLLGLPMDGAEETTSTAGKRFAAWHYNASNPANNRDTYDLWMDIVIKNKTNRICNWSETPLIIQ
jgi:prepilin-type N-terminal cleavage/methylation domain-containing protein